MTKTKVKKKRKVYFGKEVQNAIIEYNKLNNLPGNEYKKKKLFDTLIYPAFDILCENIINTWKFHRYETTYTDLKLETVSFLYSKIDGYKETKGRAYSYFTIIARNFLIKKSSTLYKYNKSKNQIDVVDIERNVASEMYKKSDQENLKNFMHLWCDHVEKNIDKYFTSERDKKITDAIIELMRNTDDIDIYNKKMLYILIRDRADVKTDQITNTIKKIKKLFYEHYKEYENL